MRTRGAVVAQSTAALVAIGTIGVAAGAAAENDKGTVKVSDEAGCTEISNNPKIVDEFWIGGFEFGANKSGQLTITTQPGGETALGPVEVTADGDGNFCAGPYMLDEGQYKVNFVFTTASGKSKVFKVEVTVPDEPEIPEEPTAPEHAADADADADDTEAERCAAGEDLDADSCGRAADRLLGGFADHVDLAKVLVDGPRGGHAGRRGHHRARADVGRGAVLVGDGGAAGQHHEHLVGLDVDGLPGRVLPDADRQPGGRVADELATGRRR